MWFVCCYSEDSWEKTAADLSDAEAAAVNASGSDIDTGHKATAVSGKITTGDDDHCI